MNKYSERKLNSWYDNFEPKIQYRNSGFILYNQFIGQKKNNPQLDSRFKTKPNNTYSGEFTLNAKKRLKKTIDTLLQITKPERKFHPFLKKIVTHQLSIITLTIPDDTLIHPSTTHKLLLEPFIKWLRDTQNVKSYIWKLEYQKRGQIHYHITLPNMVHLNQIRDKWNYYLRINNLTLNYFQEHKHHNPNSTDIHKVYRIKNLQSYLEKEFIKSIQNQNPHGSYTPLEAASNKFKYWDCSLNLKSNKLYTTAIDNKEEQQIIDTLNNTNLKVTLIEKEHCSIVQFNQKTIHKIIPTHSRNDYADYIENIKNYVRQPVKKKSEILI
jgi:hypothetical protein